MKLIVITLIISATFTTCGISQSEKENLKKENEQLRKEIEQLKTDKEEVSSAKRKLDIKEAAFMHTEAEALKFLKDYYEFYNADVTYRRPKVRRESDNTFRISLQECTKKADFKNNDFFWNARVLTLQINDDGTYKVK